jgi:hypothetical protein
MSTINDVVGVRSRGLWQASDRARSSAITTAAAGRDLTAVVVFSAIGLFLSLSVLLFPGGSAIIAAMP